MSDSTELKEMLEEEQRNSTPKPVEEEIEENPPVLGTWKNLYLLVIGNLLFLIVMFYLFTRYFS